MLFTITDNAELIMEHIVLCKEVKFDNFVEFSDCITDTYDPSASCFFNKKDYLEQKKPEELEESEKKYQKLETLCNKATAKQNLIFIAQRILSGEEDEKKEDEKIASYFNKYHTKSNIDASVLALQGRNKRRARQLESEESEESEDTTPGKKMKPGLQSELSKLTIIEYTKRQENYIQQLVQQALRKKPGNDFSLNNFFHYIAQNIKLITKISRKLSQIDDMQLAIICHYFGEKDMKDIARLTYDEIKKGCDDYIRKAQNNDQEVMGKIVEFQLYQLAITAFRYIKEERERCKTTPNPTMSVITEKKLVGLLAPIRQSITEEQAREMLSSKTDQDNTILHLLFGAKVDTGTMIDQETCYKTIEKIKVGQIRRLVSLKRNHSLDDLCVECCLTQNKDGDTPFLILVKKINQAVKTDRFIQEVKKNVNVDVWSPLMKSKKLCGIIDLRNNLGETIHAIFTELEAKTAEDDKGDFGVVVQNLRAILGSHLGVVKKFKKQPENSAISAIDSAPPPPTYSSNPSTSPQLQDRLYRTGSNKKR
jgi:hypothetical protein